MRPPRTSDARSPAKDPVDPPRRPPGPESNAALDAPFSVPRSRDIRRIDWWFRILAPHRIHWAMIEPAPESCTVFTFFVDSGSGVFKRISLRSVVDAKRRLLNLGFDRLAAKPAVRSRFSPPAGSFRLVEWPDDEVPAQGADARRGAGASTRSTAVSAPSRPQDSASAHTAQPAVPIMVRVELHGTPRCLLGLKPEVPRKLRRLHLVGGISLQCLGRTKNDEHEVTIGIDFGTSSTKVVIGDSSLATAFAVPFCEASGVGVYLMPSRLLESRAPASNGSEHAVFSFEHGDVVHRDIKLAWLANPDSPTHQARVAAFLALVLRHARGWLFREHASIYKPVTITWRVAVGLPAASALDNRLADTLHRLARRAWLVSCHEGDVDECAVETTASLQDEPESREPQIDIVPEIAAQIFGFVTSHSFDRKAPNRYLLVDIGAGTIDSSLFRVKPGRGRKWDFEFFTAVVEPHGVANLHVRRINWWQGLLESAPAAAKAISDLERNKFATDFEGGIPQRFDEYVSGVRVVDTGAAPRDPDLRFLHRKVIPQVRGATLYRAWKEQLLPQNAIEGMPMFLCGGGSRMPFYQRIEEELRRQPGFTWLHAERWELGFPADLKCEEPIDRDYDRLSVAYGLSRLDVGRVIRALPMPKVESPPPAPWTDRYVDKDQV